MCRGYVSITPGVGETFSCLMLCCSQWFHILVGLPERTSYAASKFAVQGYCEALRGELASSGVSVHCASPGYIRTNLSKSAVTGDGTPHGKMDSATASGEFMLLYMKAIKPHDGHLSFSLLSVLYRC